MKTNFRTKLSFRSGSALALTMIMTGIALAILASTMAWSVNTTRLTHRSVQYTRAVAAAEAGTEKVVTRITRDFLTGGDRLVSDNLATYRLAVPNSTDSSYWDGWEFNNAAGDVGQTFVESGTSTNFVALNTSYSGLRAFVSTMRVVSHARDTTAPQDVMAGVLQGVQLARIPIFQFALYSSGDMEISCGKPFAVTGRVHANDHLYVEPDNALTFQSDVTAVTSILFQRHPLDTRGKPAGGVVYEHPELKVSPVSPLTLPIGTTNTPEAVREIVQPPSPPDEDPDSPLGRLRYYNQAAMILVVSNSGVSATSGRADNFATPVPTNELAAIVTTTNSFRDAREGKTVRPVDIDVGALADWSRTNTSLKSIASVYVLDRRTLAGTQLAAVRLRNGKTLPAKGLTVATARPLYVLGNYNQTNAANLGTTNTSSTKPASLVADAVTLLSVNWTDANSTNSLSSRAAKPTTVNAAILTGVVETTKGKYSGGMENFPRFLETWDTANILTYNGSMVKMFPSLYATNVWGMDDVYVPPKRNWAYDLNFNDPAKLPPLTPSLLKVIRGQWATVPPNQNTVAANP